MNSEMRVGTLVLITEKERTIREIMNNFMPTNWITQKK